MSHALRCRWILALPVVVACSNPPATPTTGNGELHQGTFAYACATDADSACASGLAPSELPTIALGARFDLGFTSASGTKASLAPSRDFFSIDASGSFVAKRRGFGAMLAKDERDGVVDFVNLRVKAIASLAIAGVEEAAPVELGQTRTLSASPLDATGEALAGTVPLEWESSDPSVFTLTTTAEDRARGTATLVAVGAGAARVRVVSGSATSAAIVRVGGAR